jgi:hypothetical protein
MAAVSQFETAATGPDDSIEGASMEVATFPGPSSKPVDFNRGFWTTLSEDGRLCGMH